MAATARLAVNIGKGISKKTVAAGVDGEHANLFLPLNECAIVKFTDRNDPRKLAIIHHDLAHIMAGAVQALWLGTKTAVEPAVRAWLSLRF
ncbi:MAG: hypothetical protein OXC72_12280 [Roseovarius sp.]|nr:hypothetical protein [Roseovarius sp.]